MTLKHEKPVLITHAQYFWNNACIRPFSDNWVTYPRGYKKAADLMVAHIDKRHCDQDTLVYPIVFLYRQYIELRLKHLVRDAAEVLDRNHKVPQTHRLLDL